MKREIIFSETQRFRQWWLWLPLLAIDGLMLFGVFTQVICNRQIGDNPMSNFGLLFVLGGLLLLNLFFFSIRLSTTVKQDGVYVQFFPFHFKAKHFPWKNLKHYYVRQYSPLGEFGGWGWRISLTGSGTAHNISGNKGLQLEFENGKKLLIGTNKPKELEEALSKIEYIKN